MSSMSEEEIVKPVSPEEAYERLTKGCGLAVIEGQLPALGERVVFVKDESVHRPKSILDLPTYIWPDLKPVHQF